MNRTVAILTVLLSFACNALHAQVVYSPNQYIEYHVGNVPIVISAPHGGQLTPAAIPDRTCNNPTLVTDLNTKELAHAVDSIFFVNTGCRMHIIICNLKRTKLDCNRNISNGACGNADAEIAWNAFHHFIDSAQNLAETITPEPFYIDLHGHGHPKQRLELGYLLSGTKLRNSDSTLNTTPYINYSSIQNMVSSNVHANTHAELLRGSYALGTLMAYAGYPAVPSMQDIYPDTADAFFSGGYNTQEHTCANASVNANGVQMEMNYTGVRDNAANIHAFADTLSRVLAVYLNHHFNINVGACSTVGVQDAVASAMEIYPSLLAAGESIHLTTAEKQLDYQIYNATGILVQAGTCTQRIAIKPDLAAGAYILQVSSTKAQSHFKFLVR